MRFEEFERRARDEWERIPEAYKAGIDGLIIERDARPHPDTPDVYTLGECVTEAYPSEVGGPDTVRSSVLLYYGSFLRLSRLDDSFDWGEEIWETLTHELKHHLESLAAEDALIDVDYGMDQIFRRHAGESFDPFFYRAGERLGESGFMLEKNLFVERVLTETADAVEFDVGSARYRVGVPEQRGDVTFIDITKGVDAPDLEEVTLVLVRPRGLRHALRSVFRRAAPSVVEADAAVERVERE